MTPDRLNLDKTPVVVAVQEDGQGIGRIRMRQIFDASSARLIYLYRRLDGSGQRDSYLCLLGLFALEG